MRVQLEDPVLVWITFLVVIVPAFIISFKSGLLTWDLRITAWIGMVIFIWIFYQYYLVQGGSYYGKGILG